MSEGPMIRLIVTDTDSTDMYHVGGPLKVTHKTFDVPIPDVLAAYLSEKHQHCSRFIAGVEFLPATRP